LFKFKFKTKYLGGLRWACFGDLTYPNGSNTGVLSFFETRNLSAVTTYLIGRHRTCLVAYSQNAVVLVGGMINGVASKLLTLKPISGLNSDFASLQYPRIEAACLNIGNGRIFIFGGFTETTTRLLIFYFFIFLFF
jgi:hypothetical protein